MQNQAWKATQDRTQRQARRAPSHKIKAQLGTRVMMKMDPRLAQRSQASRPLQQGPLEPASLTQRKVLQGDHKGAGRVQPFPHLLKSTPNTTVDEALNRAQ